MALRTQHKTPGDLVVHVESLEYCTKSAILRNTMLSTVKLDNFVGYPLTTGTNGADFNIATIGNELSVIALLVDGPGGLISLSIPATSNTVVQFKVLANPPTVINQNAMRTEDITGGPFNMAVIIAVLEALGWEIRTEPG